MFTIGFLRGDWHTSVIPPLPKYLIDGWDVCLQRGRVRVVHRENVCHERPGNSTVRILSVDQFVDEL